MATSQILRGDAVRIVREAWGGGDQKVASARVVRRRGDDDFLVCVAGTVWLWAMRSVLRLERSSPAPRFDAPATPGYLSPFEPPRTLCRDLKVRGLEEPAVRALIREIPAQTDAVMVLGNTLADSLYSSGVRSIGFETVEAWVLEHNPKLEVVSSWLREMPPVGCGPIQGDYERTCTIDLHPLIFRGALYPAEEAVRTAFANGTIVLRIIHGKGLNNGQGKLGVLRGQVHDLLTRLHAESFPTMRWQLERNNDGATIVVFD